VSKMTNEHDNDQPRVKACNSFGHSVRATTMMTGDSGSCGLHTGINCDERAVRSDVLNELEVGGSCVIERNSTPFNHTRQRDPSSTR
jgi:hypothetical protein